MNTLAFKMPYVPMIKSGEKTQTVRLGTALEVGQVVAAHCRWGEPPFAYLRIEEIIRKAIDDLDDDDAARDGFANREELVQAVLTFYPRAQEVALIRFRRVRKPRKRASRDRALSAQS